MAVARKALTLEQFEAAIGRPIVLLEADDETQGRLVQLTVRDLGAVAIVTVLAWLNAHANQT